MKSFLLLLLLAVTAFACSQKKEDIPACVQTYIDDYVAAGGTPSGCTEKATVILYSFQADEVYVISNQPCVADGASTVVDTDCNALGILGGIAGIQDVNGENFYDNAIYIRQVWSE